MRNFFVTLLVALGIGSASAAQAPKTPPAKMSSNLRAMVFNLSAGDIGVTPDNYHHKVWGVVMETGLDTGYYTLVSLADGSTSLYFSTGGGIIGAGEHPGARDASAAFISTANHDLAQARSSTDHTPPAKGETVFYFLTFDGTKVYHAPEEDLGKGQDKLSNLFYAAQATITAIREAQPQ
jgi:hypothetical protein